MFFCFIMFKLFKTVDLKCNKQDLFTLFSVFVNENVNSFISHKKSVFTQLRDFKEESSLHIHL